jgi:preprotein translocase subunit SecD
MRRDPAAEGSTHQPVETRPRLRSTLRGCVCGGFMLWVAIGTAEAQAVSWPSIPAQLNIQTDVAELTTDRIQRTLLEIRLARTEQGTKPEDATALIDAFLRDSGRRYYMDKIPLATNNDVIEARVLQEQGRFKVVVTLTADAAARMEAATSAHRGKPLAIIVNGELVSAPIVQTAISTDVVISGDFTREEARRIAAGLQR